MPLWVPLGSIGTPRASPGEVNKGIFCGNRSEEGFGRVQGTIWELFFIDFGCYVGWCWDGFLSKCAVVVSYMSVNSGNDLYK